MPSPPLKHHRTEEHGAFVPPQFYLPTRPPISGFPNREDIVVAQARTGSRNVDGKALLLNASPTLGFPTEEATALLTALRQHPACATIREQLSTINEAYLENIFGEEDAREDDTRRRVDYNAACAALKSNSSKRLSMCVSCLTRGQHRHYRSWVINHMQTGVVPKATDEYPDMSTVLDLVQREQTAYLHKFMEETVSCEACKLEAGCKKRCAEGEGDAAASHSSCWNHNYMDERVARFAKRWWRYRLEARLLRCLHEGEEAEDNCDGNTGDFFSDVFFDIKKSVASREEGARPVVTLTARTRHCAARCIAATVARRGTRGEVRCPPGVFVPPTFPLAVSQLDERAPQLHLAVCAGPLHDETKGEEEHKGENVAGAGGETVMDKPQDAEPPLVHPVSSVPGVSFSLRVCKSALVELASAHLSACRADFRLPVRCAWHPLERRVDICVEKPLPGDRVSRRNINAAVLKRLVDSEPRLPSNGRCSERGGCETKCHAEVSFGQDFSFHCVSNCTYDMQNQNPVFRMVKMEYNCKGYNTLPDDEKTFHYESFSKREVVYMWVLLHCNPTASLYVYRINAYSNSVIGIEQFSSVSFMSQVMGSWSSDVEVQRTWSTLRDVLQSVVSAVVHRQQQLLRQLPEDTNNVRNFTFIIRKEKENGNLSLCSVKAFCPQKTVLLDEAVESFIEPSSRTVCRREYLPPSVWPFPDRIPYTYGPVPKTCHVINRTTETRFPSEHYAKHDVWHHESRYYTVGEDGVIRERQPADL